MLLRNPKNVLHPCNTRQCIRDSDRVLWDVFDPGSFLSDGQMASSWPPVLATTIMATTSVSVPVSRHRNTIHLYLPIRTWKLQYVCRHVFATWTRSSNSSSRSSRTYSDAPNDIAADLFRYTMLSFFFWTTRKNRTHKFICIPLHHRRYRHDTKKVGFQVAATVSHNRTSNGFITFAYNDYVESYWFIEIQ